MNRWLPPLALLAGIGATTLLVLGCRVLNRAADRYLTRHFERAALIHLPDRSNVTTLHRRGNARVVRIDSKRTGGAA